MERSQLDISDPYKVYRIVPEGAKKGGACRAGAACARASRRLPVRVLFSLCCFVAGSPWPPGPA